MTGQTPIADPLQLAELRQENARCRSDCRRLESALQESDRRYRALLYNLPEKVFHKDRDSVYVSCNRNYAADFGLEPEQMVGKTDYDLFPRDTAAKYRADDSRVMASGKTEEIEEIYYLSTGEQRLIRTVKAALRNEHGQVTGILGVFSDITARKRAEKERQASEAKYRRLHQSMRDAFVSVSMDGRIQECNDAYCQMLGYSRDELQTLTYHDLTPTRWHPVEAEIVHTQVLPRGYSEIYAKEYQRKNGTIFPVELRTFLIADDGGEPAAMWAIVRDITERRAQEAALQRSHDELERKVRERTAELVKSNASLRAEIQERLRAQHDLSQSEAKYKALVESSPDAVVLCDLDGSIVFASPRAAEQHGYGDARELVGRPATDFVVPEDRAMMRENIRRLIREGIRRNHQYRALRRDGQMFYGEISAAVIRDAAGNPEALMGIYRDITDRKLAEAARQRLDAELFAAAEIQALLLPHAPPQVNGFDIAGRCFPAEAAAGDHFDFLGCPDGSLMVVLGDVSGHGLGPAIVAAAFCARLRTLSETPCELPELAARVHSGLYRETGGVVFVTAILGRLDPASRTFTCLNAGHPPVIVLDSTGMEKARLKSGGLPYAIVEKTPFVADDPLELAKGDLLFFYTDGLTEAQRAEGFQFGLDRAIQIVKDNRDRTAAEIIEVLYRAACEHIAPDHPADDITLVIVKVLAHAPESSFAGAPAGGCDANLFVPGGSRQKTHLIECDSFAVEQCGDALIVRFVDTRHFDTGRYVQLQQDLVDFIEHHRPAVLLLDLGRVAFCSTAFINALLMAQKCVQAGSGKMMLFGLHGVLREAMEHLKMIGTVLSVCDDETAAKQACAGSSADPAP